MMMLMANKDLRIHYGQMAKEEMKQYAPEIIWGKWDNLIDEFIS